MTRQHRIAKLVLAVLTPQVLETIAKRYGVDINIAEDVNVNVNQLARYQIGEPLIRSMDLIVEWVIKNIANKSLIWKEDLYKVWSAFKYLLNEESHDLRVTAKELFPGKNPKNILDFTPQDIEEIFEDSADRKEQEKHRNLQAKLPEGARIFYSGDGWTIVEVTDAHAACALGKGTKWCTSTVDSGGFPGTADQYLENGPLYIFYGGNRKQAQLHVPENGGIWQFMDLRDREIKPSGTLRDALFKSGLMKRGLDTLDIDDSKDDASMLESVVGVDRYPPIEPFLAKEATLALVYAVYVLRGPFPPAEPVFARSRWLAVKYAASALRGPFPLAEEAIASSGYSAVEYAIHVLHGRFPLGEPEILRNWDLEDEYKAFLESIGKAGGIKWQHN